MLEKIKNLSSSRKQDLIVCCLGIFFVGLAMLIGG